MANVIGGRQLIIDTAGVINLPMNFKVIDAWWQDITAASQVLTFNDASGRSFSFTSWSSGGTGFPPVPIGKLDWMAGPLTVSAIPSGKLYMILGNK